MKYYNVLRLEGGMGNQLFQYAFARNLSNKFGGVILFDLRSLRLDDLRDVSINNFNINQKIAKLKPTNFEKFIIFYARYKYFFFKVLDSIQKEFISTKLLIFFGIYLQRSTVYKDYKKKSIFPIRYISGNFMSEKYFIEAKHIICNEFKIKKLSLSSNINLMSKISQENSICVHIRRGDYLNSKWSNQLLVCNNIYYNNAINELSKLIDNPIFFIFSNSPKDIRWIKNNYIFDENVNFINFKNDDIGDFDLMINFKHFILSNSSYSWWASYLSKHIDKKIVAPSKWNNNIYNMDAIYLNDWILINVD